MPLEKKDSRVKSAEDMLYIEPIVGKITISILNILRTLVDRYHYLLTPNPYSPLFLPPGTHYLEGMPQNQLKCTLPTYCATKAGNLT